MIGLDMVRTNLVKDVTVEEGMVKINVDLPKNH